MVDETTLQADLQKAMRARDMRRVYVLRGVLTALKNLRVEKSGADPEEAEVAAVLRKELNKRREAEEFAAKAGRTELIDENRAEAAVLESYLPASLGEAELTEAVKTIAAELGTTQMGAVMAELRKRFAGRYDGKRASEIVRGLAQS